MKKLNLSDEKLKKWMDDYVEKNNYYPTENAFSNFNVIANKSLKVEGRLIDASLISPSLLSEKLHEIGGNEANVATGYHAIEFLLILAQRGDLI